MYLNLLCISTLSAHQLAVSCSVHSLFLLAAFYLIHTVELHINQWLLPLFGLSLLLLHEMKPSLISCHCWNTKRDSSNFTLLILFSGEKIKLGQEEDFLVFTLSFCTRILQSPKVLCSLASSLVIFASIAAAFNEQAWLKEQGWVVHWPPRIATLKMVLMPSSSDIHSSAL